MSLQIAAQHIKAQGRGPDDQLVHMTSNEVKGLEALARAKGGQLSINPNTGLPEAGFLEDILPVVVGVGLDMFAPGLGEAVGGAFGLSGAAGTGILTGGLTGLVTGDLSKGLMAGLGAYGGAGMAENFMGAGKSALMSNASDLALKQQEELAAKAMSGGLGGMADQSNAAKQLIEQMPNLDVGVKQGLYSGLESGGDPQTILRNAAQANAAMASPDTIAKAGWDAVSQAPGQFLKGNLKNIGMAAAPVLAGLATTQPTVQPQQPYSGILSKYKLSPNFQAAAPVQPNPYYTAQYPNYVKNPYVPTMADGGLAGTETGNMFPQSQQDHTQFATPTQMPTSAQVIQADYQPQTNPMTGQETVAGLAAGGVLKFAKGGDYLPSRPSIPPVGIYHDTDVDTAKKDALTATLIRNKKAAAGAGLKTMGLPKARIAGLGDISGFTQDTEPLAGGGSIGGYSDGGRMLKGPGDGMSDSIPATISGKQPARLADSEFVVPADVVSHLGNGSTDAGAKRLYKMMDQVRQARTGRKKQSPAIKADKYIPKA